MADEMRNADLILEISFGNFDRQRLGVSEIDWGSNIILLQTIYIDGGGTEGG